MIPKPPIIKLDVNEDPALYTFDEGASAQRDADAEYYEGKLKDLEVQYLALLNSALDAYIKLETLHNNDAKQYEGKLEQLRAEVLKEVVQKLMPIYKRSTTITEYALKLARLIDELNEALKSGTMPDVRRNTKADPELGME